MKQKAHAHLKRSRRPALVSLYLLLLPLCFSCKDADSSEEQFNPNNSVEVTAIVPETGSVALPLVIHGKNFGNDKSKIKVLFDDVQASVITAKNEHLYVLNPRQSGGEHTVKVIVEDKEGTLKEKFNYIVTSSVSTVAGTGELGDKDGNALEATLAGPLYISVDDKGNIIITEDYDYLRLLSLSESKVTTLLVDESTYGSCFSPDYSTLYVGIEGYSIIANEFDCTSNWARTITPNTIDMEYGTPAIAVDRDGNVYYIGCLGEIVRKDVRTDRISKIGQLNGDMIDTNVDYYAAYNPKDNHIYVSSRDEHIIIRFEAKESLEDEDFELYAGKRGQSGLSNSTRLESTFDTPKGMAFDSKGNMYIADSENNVIRMINPEGKVSTFIGKPEGGHKDGAVEEALFRRPCDVAITPDDIIYVADRSNYRIRCIAIQ